MEERPGASKEEAKRVRWRVEGEEVIGDVWEGVLGRGRCALLPCLTRPSPSYPSPADRKSVV